MDSVGLSPVDSVGLSPLDSVGLSPMDSVGLSRTLLSQPVWRNPAESSGQSPADLSGPNPAVHQNMAYSGGLHWTPPGLDMSIWPLSH